MSSYLCSTELLKVQNRMICTFRNSVLFDQVVNNACRNSWNHNSKRFALSETPLSGIQKVLYLTELLLVIIKTICIKRNSWNHKQELFWMKRSSGNRYSEWFALSGTPFDIKEKWFALKGEQETDIHLQFALNEASETIIRFYLNKTELKKLMFTMFFTFVKKVLMQIPYKRILKLEVSQDVSETACADLS